MCQTYFALAPDFTLMLLRSPLCSRNTGPQPEIRTQNIPTLYQIFVRIIDRFLAAVMPCGQLGQAEVDGRRADIAKLAGAGVFKNGIGVYGDKADEW
jgi:hypothetical protein